MLLSERNAAERQPVRELVAAWIVAGIAAGSGLCFLEIQAAGKDAVPVPRSERSSAQVGEPSAESVTDAARHRVDDERAPAEWEKAARRNRRAG